MIEITKRSDNKFNIHTTLKSDKEVVDKIIDNYLDDDDLDKTFDPNNPPAAAAAYVVLKNEASYKKFFDGCKRKGVKEIMLSHMKNPPVPGYPGQTIKPSEYKEAPELLTH